MAGEMGPRALLPHIAQASAFDFVPNPPLRQEQQRNYVFVDEHNRHKRLKVMRACDGCRRRKIKCDAATTNTWPCAACTRLKLPCVPPTVSYEKDGGSDSQTFDVKPSQSAFRTVDHVQVYQPVMPPQPSPSVSQTIAQPLPAHTFTSAFSTYPTSSYLDLSASNLPAYDAASVTNGHFAYGQNAYDSSYHHPAAGDLAWNSRRGIDPDHLADAMGELSIDHTGIAPYIAAQRKNLQRAQAVEEYEAELPLTIHTNVDAKVRIPLEMFPSEQRALQYFKFFFDNIHPYCPVINRSHFYHEWYTDKESISPLLLEAIFACASTQLEGQQAGLRWLALASKHEENFKDVARLSTVQAMIILLKAREALPKKGYYYRSWMTVVNAVLMAIELDLHEHFDLHKEGLQCELKPHECAITTRVWSTLFAIEIMVGGPQGRSDFRVDADTVDFSVPTHINGFDDKDLQVSRHFTFLLRVNKNVKITNTTWQSLKKKKKDWGLDPTFVGHNQSFAQLTQDLPGDLQVQLPLDGSTPSIPSHYAGQLHIYHHLSIIMHHRPQMTFLSNARNPEWRSHMLLCHSSAKIMCRIQEAIVERYGITSLSCMQRGISFTIYAILTCTMLHLAAITAPDPEINGEAEDFFCRHMRLLEKCYHLWDMADMQAQINSLREAFSADITKPFELKASFPQGSPPAQRMSQSPPFQTTGLFGRVPGPIHHEAAIPLDSATGQISAALRTPSHAFAATHPITPPVSTTDSEPQTDPPLDQSLVNMPMVTNQMIAPRAATARAAGILAATPEQQALTWNPTRLFDQWTAAFTPPPPSHTQSPPLSQTSGTYEQRSRLDSNATSVYTPQNGNFATPPAATAAASGLDSGSQDAVYQQQVALQMNNIVTPSEWQELVTGTLKRPYPGYDMPMGIGEVVSKRAR